MIIGFSIFALVVIFMIFMITEGDINPRRLKVIKIVTPLLFLIIIMTVQYERIIKIKNTLVDYETKIEFVDVQLMNIHSGNFKVIKSLTQNYKLADKDLEEITKLYMDGRKISSNALFIVMNEKVPNINKELVVQLNNTIAGNYEKFSKMQNHKIELIRDYKTELKLGIVRPFIVKILGFPNVSLDTDIVIIKETKEVFKNNEDKIVDLND